PARFQPSPVGGLSASLRAMARGMAVAHHFTTAVGTLARRIAEVVKARLLHVGADLFQPFPEEQSVDITRLHLARLHFLDQHLRKRLLIEPRQHADPLQGPQHKLQRKLSRGRPAHDRPRSRSSCSRSAARSMMLAMRYASRSWSDTTAASSASIVRSLMI